MPVAVSYTFLRNERLDLTGQIGVQTLLEHRRNLPAGFDLEPAERRFSGRLQVVPDLRFVRAREKSFLA